MESIYAEAGVKRNNTFGLILLRLLFVFGVIFTFMFAAVIANKLLFVGGAILAFLVIWFWPRLNVEWEYIFVDGQLDFDTISGGEKRKTRLRIDFNDVEIVAPLASHSLDAYRHYRVRNYSSLRKDAKIYVVVVKIDNDGLCQIYFEPSEKMVQMMKAKSPRKVMSL